MHAVRTTRTRTHWKTCALGAAAVAALLAGPVGEASGADAGTTAAGQGKSSPRRALPCTDQDVSVSARAEARDSLRHLVLTAVNTGGRTCTLYAYPLVRFDQGSYDEVGPLESNYKAVATLAPGQKAYAGMRLFRAGEETRAVETLTLGFQGAGSAGEVGSPIDVPLPGGVPFVNVDAGVGVTYWDRNLKSVYAYTFAT
ncbi:DUF4232 domain-containing protein [Streptomyces polyrhachis]|uniref:DUF4232 domain-containing protein n=1 Tax=Streptomyces polyrhachis TaxID=1282885 RepID=A0ABW2GER9_9ACTN